MPNDLLAKLFPIVGNANSQLALRGPNKSAKVQRHFTMPNSAPMFRMMNIHADSDPR